MLDPLMHFGGVVLVVVSVTPIALYTVSNKTVPMLHTFGMIGEYWQSH